jgi:CPA2 family monovalent cation:H+ antiporter-2
MAGELHGESISDLLVILGAAGIVIPAFARFRITPIIGFILVGILVGPMGLGTLVERYPLLEWVTITNPEAIRPIGEYGIILLLFSIGLELSFRRLWKMRRLVFGVGASQLFGAGIIIAAGLLLFGYNLTAAIGIGIALALSSTALVLPLANRRLQCCCSKILPSSRSSSSWARSHHKRVRIRGRAWLRCSGRAHW